jgi:chromosome segregation ATPase
LTAEKETLQDELSDLSEQNATLQHEKTQIITEKHQLQQELTQAQEAINQLTQELAHERKQKNAVKNNLAQEKQISHNLWQQLQNEKETNANLKQIINNYEQNHTNLINTYQIALKDKERAEKSAQAEKQHAFIQKKRVDHYENQLKSIAKSIHQWQKLNHCQQLGKQNELQAQIIQIKRPPPFKQK